MNRLICFLLLISLAAIGLNPLVAIAQSLTWSLPQRIAGYEDESSSPYLIADQNKIVHAFNTDNVDGMVAVTYSQWTLEQGWTEPIDVLMLPNQMSLHLVSVFLDQAGVVHIICFGGNEINANIYYAQAPIENAGQAPAWSPALMIGKAAIMPVTGAIWGDELGNLAVVYSGNLDGNGLYAVYSSDGGGVLVGCSSYFFNL